MLNKQGGYFTDEAIKTRVKERIGWDKRISDFDIKVIAKDCHVLLIGQVDTASRKEAAVEIAMNTVGVISVKDLILVQLPFLRSDSELKSLIIKKLRTLEMVETENIAISVNQGRVRLTGLVHSALKKATAVGFVWELSGIVDCLNVIEIESPPPSITAENPSLPWQHPSCIDK